MLCVCLFTDSGVTTDQETSSAARIMVLSIFPFAFLLIPELFGLNPSQGYMILIALPVSIMFLLVYFIYQVFSSCIYVQLFETCFVFLNIY